MPRPPAEPARAARDGRRHAACRSLRQNLSFLAASGAPPVRSRVDAACSLTSDPLGGHRYLRPHVSTARPDLRGQIWLRRREAEFHKSELQLIARTDLHKHASIESYSVEKGGIHGPNFFAQEEHRAASVNLGMAATHRLLRIYRRKVNIRIDPGDRILVSNCGLGAVGERELHA